MDEMLQILGGLHQLKKAVDDTEKAAACVKRRLRKMLELAGETRHAFNVFDTAVARGYNTTDIRFEDDVVFLFDYFDYISDRDVYERYTFNNTGSIKSRRKAARKLWFAYSIAGRAGVLSLLEMKNRAIREFLWKEVIGEES